MAGNFVRAAAFVAGMIAMLPSSHAAAQTAVAAAPGEVNPASSITVSVDRAPIDLVLQTIARQAGVRLVYERSILPEGATVTLSLRDVSAERAFAEALTGTRVHALRVTNDVIALKADDAAETADGAITGRVIDASTRLPIAGAMVTIDKTTRGVITDRIGAFRFPGIHAGAHVVNVRMLGYRKGEKSVAVMNDSVATVEVTMTQSTAALEQVVVTGTVVATELKAVPSAITVITAKDIEQRGITRIDQLFHGDVPGLFAANQGSASPVDGVTMFSRGATYLDSYVAGTGFTNFTNPIKTYVDGVELADAQYLSQIDPKSIERIEILTGPQASTIYGSNALNGVMQIFTKRGTSSTPRLALSLLSGFVQNNFSNSLTPQHDVSGQLSGVEGKISYNIGTSWNYIGAWTPSKQTSVLSGFGGTRLSLPTRVGAVTIDMSLRQTVTENRSHGNYYSPGEIANYQNGHETVTDGAYGGSSLLTTILDGQTLGLTLGYAPTAWWSNELAVGRDISDVEGRPTVPGFAKPYDTVLVYNDTRASRRSLRGTTTARVPLSALAQLTVTLGAEGRQTLTNSLFGVTSALTGTFNVNTSETRTPEHNTGAFVQAQLGVIDQLFLTYGLRAEWNPAYGVAALPNYAPRYGLAYTRDLGPVTTKFRASYGRSTRPPSTPQKLAQPNGSPELAAVYGTYNQQLANPDLGPEFQQGGEGGIELYLGNRASVVVTRYNQTVDNLILNVPGADSVRSLAPNPLIYGYTCAVIIPYHYPSWCSSEDANGYAYAIQTQNANVASIRNQGWELQGTLTTGPLTTKGTYSWTRSRTLGVTSKYKSRFSATDYPQYQPGATFLFLPEHTWALGTTYARGGTTATVTFTGIGQYASYQNELFLQLLSYGLRLQQYAARWNGNNALSQVGLRSRYIQADMTASRRLTSHVETVMEMQNMGNQYRADMSALDGVIGRQTKLGFRIR